MSVRATARRAIEVVRGGGRAGLRSDIGPEDPPTCRACGSGSSAPAFATDGIAYRDCAACGARFAEPGPNANFETAIEAYPDAYLQYLADDPADERNHAALLAQLEKLGADLRGPVLDVGCGSGKLVRYLRSRSIEAHGVEPAAPLFDRFLGGRDGFFRSLGEAPGPYPVVLALDVLEHVERPGQLLSELATRMSPGGRLVVSTPDAGSLVARALGRRWHHCNRWHLCLFDERALRDAAEGSGLRQVGIAHPGRRRAAGYAVRYLFEFGLGRQAPEIAKRLDRVTVPINLRDTMLVGFAPR